MNGGTMHFEQCSVDGGTSLTAVYLNDWLFPFAWIDVSEETSFKLKVVL